MTEVFEMMKKEIVQKMKKLGLWDPAYGCILIAAGVLFLYVSLYYFAYDFYIRENLLHLSKSFLPNRKALDKSLHIPA